jgi:hypothetical protein
MNTILFSLLLSAAAAGAQEPGAPAMDRRMAAARAIVQLTGSSKSLTQAMDGIRATMQKAYPKVPEQFWTDVKAEITVEEVADRVAPIYAKHFTDRELEELLSFYRSPIGQRLIEAQPAMVAEMFSVAHEWGREVARRILERLKQKGYAGKANTD